MLSSPEDQQIWASGEAYEPYIGRWSRLVAREFVEWLEVPPSRRWLDIGCGTGALCEVILETATPIELVAVDPSEAYIEFARDRLTDRRARFLVGSAEHLPVGHGAFDVAVAGLVLNFVSDPMRGVSEMTRAVGRGGTVAAYVWDYAEGMQMIRRFWDSAAELDPAARELDEGRKFQLCSADALGALFETARLQDVEVRAIDVVTRFRDFDDYWSPFLGGDAPAPSYAMSLSEAQREALKDNLRTALPPGDDGSIDLTARAWAVRGRK
jgi:SAM-dependent methyltransferase